MSKATVIAGVDEAGRGPLAGPVVAAAVILDEHRKISGLRDSKQLNEKQRNQLYEEIIHSCVSYAIGRAEVDEIDTINILQATLLAMQRAVLALGQAPELVLIDGNRAPSLPYPTQVIIQGDQSVKAISAASILAKVERDREMIALDKQFPQYGFAQHKGYGTEQHLAALHKYGVSVVHRRSFGPVRLLINI